MKGDKKAKILIVGSEIDTLDITSLYLRAKGYSISTVAEGNLAAELIRSELPDLVLLDMQLPDMHGSEIIMQLKRDPELWHTPVIFFTEKNKTSDRITGMQAGADDYIFKPFDTEELLSRIKMILYRTMHTLDASPLTKLPGNTSINNKIMHLLEQASKFAICYLDIDHFKSFNDEYGFRQGDIILENTAELLTATVNACESTSGFIGHIGGDDFVFILKPENVEKVCSTLVRDFDKMVPEYYSKEARNAGHIQVKDRQGNTKKFPFMSLSIAIITNEQKEIKHIAQINELAAEIKKHAKSFEGSVYIKDRRAAV